MFLVSLLSLPFFFKNFSTPPQTPVLFVYVSDYFSIEFYGNLLKVAWQLLILI